MRKLAVAEDGAIAVVNSSFREGEVSLVRLIRGRLDKADRRLNDRGAARLETDAVPVRSTRTAEARRMRLRRATRPAICGTPASLRVEEAAQPVM